MENTCKQFYLSNCDTLLDDYKIVKKLGEGVFGIVYQIYDIHHDRKLALKILKRKQDTLNEINVGCTLNSLNKFTNVFIEIYGWGECTSLPKFNNIMFNDAEFIENNETVLIFEELADNSFEQLITQRLEKLSLSDFTSILFEIFYAITLARLRLNFIHCDLTSRNILYQMRSDIREYKIGNLLFKCKSNYFPKIADYGISTINFKPLYEYNDDRRYFLIFAWELLSLLSNNDQSIATVNLIKFSQLLFPKLIDLDLSNYIETYPNINRDISDDIDLSNFEYELYQLQSLATEKQNLLPYITQSTFFSSLL